MRDLLARLFAKYVPFNYKVWATVQHDVQIQTCVQATQASAAYALANMPFARHFTGSKLTEWSIDNQGRDKLLAYALESAIADGLVMEFGVHTGSSINVIAGLTRGAVHGFDSFEGLPEDWKAGSLKGEFSIAGRLPKVRPNVTLHPGWFENTVAPFMATQSQHVTLLHIDCDLYSSTMTVLRACDRALRVGTVIVFDEYFNYPGWEQHEFKAWKEFVAERGISYEYIGYAARHYSVAVRITAIRSAST